MAGFNYKLDVTELWLGERRCQSAFMSCTGWVQHSASIQLCTIELTGPGDFPRNSILLQLCLLMRRFTTVPAFLCDWPKSRTATPDSEAEVHMHGMTAKEAGEKVSGIFSSSTKTLKVGNYPPKHRRKIQVLGIKNVHYIYLLCSVTSQEDFVKFYFL